MFWEVKNGLFRIFRIISFRPRSHLEINFKTHNLSTLKRTANLTQPDLSDFFMSLGIYSKAVIENVQLISFNGLMLSDWDFNFRWKKCSR